MKWAPYLNYRPTRADWLPEAPQDWDVVALRWLSRRYAGGTPDKSNSAYWEDGDIPWLNSGAVNDRYITAPSEYITREGYLGSSAKWVPKGALVMALAGQGKTKGMVARMGINATCNQSMAAIVPSSRVEARYLYWWLTANYFNIRNMAGGEARDGLNLELLGDIQCPVPSSDEQRTIADFLDRETAKIDTLVKTKRTLIERLKEKRTALISRTVTKGLPPDAARAGGLDPHPKLKPSSVAWLGDVPEHWQIKPLMRLTDPSRPIMYGIVLPGPDVDEGVLIVKGGDVKPGRLSPETLCRTTAVIESGYARSRLTAADIVFSIRGSVGDAEMVPPTIEGANLTQDAARVSHRASNSPAWMLYALKCHAVIDRLIELSIGAAVRGINIRDLKRIKVPTPPTNEQQMIAAFLESETTKIESMISKVELAITRLQEYRSALITAAVTGKIDMRTTALVSEGAMAEAVP